MATKKLRRQAYEVFLDAAELGPIRKVGTLHRHEVRTDIAASFEYDDAWLQDGQAFLLDPTLQLWAGEQHPSGSAVAFGIFMDSAPDRWGRVLMERREAAAAEREKRPIKALQEMDFMLGVNDLTRIGALRMRAVPAGDEATPFLDNASPAAPPVTSLRELAHVSARLEAPGVEAMKDYERWLAMLIAPGTSLGGARPKASFVDADGTLSIAKFPSREDRYDWGGWELLVHRLAADAGVRVPSSRSEKLTDRYSTFCVSRFDRDAGSRRMYASAMTLLERHDGQVPPASYIDLAQFISDHGPQGGVESDLEQLFRRAVFNVRVGNRDDHLRNHGFIRESSGWRLSPAFDMNPSPTKSEHALTLDGVHTTSELRYVLATADLYRLDKANAARVVNEVDSAVTRWRDEADNLGLPMTEVRLMSAVFSG